MADETVLTAGDRALARRLIDEIARFNIETTGVTDFAELLVTESDDVRV